MFISKTRSMFAVCLLAVLLFSAAPQATFAQQPARVVASKGVDSSQPFAGFVNAMAKYAQYMPYAALANQAVQSAQGDPLYGTTITGATLTWNAATQTQQLIVVWYGAAGMDVPSNFQAVLTANPGPDKPWNWSYDKWASVLGLKNGLK